MAKILIVDDDLETTKLFESIIKMDKHETFSVTESRDAVTEIESITPDLILLDIMMANINGIMICKSIKSNPELKHIPVVMVSALNDDGTKRDAINAGADDFIVKPVIPTSFLKKINSILDQV